MTTIYFIRHAEAEGNLYRRVHGWYDSLITDNGYRQIAALEGRFRDVQIDAVYSSDLFRTRTTAGAIWKPHGLELRTRRDLREINLSVWEDQTWGALERDYPQELAQFNCSAAAFRLEGGESFAQVQERMVQAVFDIAKAHPDQTVAAVSHGTAIRCLQGALRGMGPGEMDTLGHSDNTAVTCVRVEGDRAELVFENDNSHLPEEISTLARQKWWKEKKGKSSDANMWFRPLDMECEPELYLQARREAWLDIHGPEVPFDGEGFLNAANHHWSHDRNAIMCAMLRDEVAGVLELDMERSAEEGVGYIPFVYMMPQHRKQGLGVQLLGQAISLYRPLGRTKLRLRCAPENAVAQRFYKKYGFTKVGEEQTDRVKLDLLEKYIGYDHQ